MGTERLGKPLRYLLSPYFQQGAPGVIRRSPHKPRLRLFLHLTGQEVSIDLNSFSLLMSECPEAAGVHHDWATNPEMRPEQDRKSTRLNSSHLVISYAVFCLKKKKKNRN